MTPGSKLDVNGTASMTGFKLGSSATAGNVLTTDANGNGTWQPDIWTVSGNNIYNNNITGNVTIGKSTPSAYKLDVNGTAAMTGFKLGSSATSGHVLTTDINGNGSWQPNLWTVLGNNIYNNNVGNVGIGTTPASPSALLDLKRYEGTTTGKNVMLKLNNTWNSSGINEPTILFANGTTSTTYGTQGWSIGAQVAGTSYFRIGTYQGSPTTTFSELFRIAYSGHVYIGSSNLIPTNNQYKLIVESGIITEKLKIALKTDAPNWKWPDYVFKKDYELMPLKELESFVTRNNHLPDIPSETEIKINGLDIADMDSKLLKKIEELTLYVIELNKKSIQVNEKIELLKKENEELKNIINNK